MKKLTIKEAFFELRTAREELGRQIAETKRISKENTCLKNIIDKLQTIENLKQKGGKE